jgi:hypothetical protein
VVYYKVSGLLDAGLITYCLGYFKYHKPVAYVRSSKNKFNFVLSPRRRGHNCGGSNL